MNPQTMNNRVTTARRHGANTTMSEERDQIDALGDARSRESDQHLDDERE